MAALKYEHFANNTLNTRILKKVKTIAHTLIQASTDSIARKTITKGKKVLIK